VKCKLAVFEEDIYKDESVVHFGAGQIPARFPVECGGKIVQVFDQPHDEDPHYYCEKCSVRYEFIP